MTEQTYSKVQFKGGGSVQLSGFLHEPAASGTASTVLITHCFTCSKDYRVIVHISRHLASRGFRVLRFDFGGSGESQGEFSEMTLATNVSDLVAAAQWLGTRGLEPAALLGHSLGGTAAILAAHLLPRIAAVGVIASPSSSTHLLELLPALRSEEFYDQGVTQVTIGGRQVQITREFVEELERHSLKESTAGLNRPFLVVHGTDDRTVPITEGERLFEFARQPKSFFSVPGSDHLFSRAEYARVAGEAITTWLESCGLKTGEPS
ncbi:MAG: alpha/beta fold hydrolase [Acidobacteria bacterium]|nr:MAG: alpha/beta fold hydrolase [Acidobacteriota bacterium]